MPAPKVSRARLALCFLAALALWLPNVHRLHGSTPESRAAFVRTSVEREVDAEENATMRAVNPEWDFMRRTFTVLALANVALASERQEERARLALAMDALVDDTLRVERERGQLHFLMSYGSRGPFRDAEGKSIFVDGELVMMMSARELVAPRSDYRQESRVRAARIERVMRRGPVLSGESYPNECWTFCNTTALAALVMLDRLEAPQGRGDASMLASEWIARAKERLVDPRTGLLASSYTYDGVVLDGPEGSSIWMTAHNLLVLDPVFARDQYDRARRELGASVLGFGYAREWPRSSPAKNADVDSGPIVPFLDASAGSSGLAILGAAAFGDTAYRDELLASVSLVGFPDARGRLRASNAVGDAVMFYALSYGPLYERVRPASRGGAGGAS